MTSLTKANIMTLQLDAPINPFEYFATFSMVFFSSGFSDFGSLHNLTKDQVIKKYFIFVLISIRKQFNYSSEEILHCVHCMGSQEKRDTTSEMGRAFRREHRKEKIRSYFKIILTPQVIHPSLKNKSAGWKFSNLYSESYARYACLYCN